MRTALAEALTPQEREQVQEHLMRRHNQVAIKRSGRRRDDLPLPTWAKSPAQREVAALRARRACGRI